MRMFHSLERVGMAAFMIYLGQHFATDNIIIWVAIIAGYVVIDEVVLALRRSVESCRGTRFKDITDDSVPPRPLSATERRIADNQRIVKRNFYNWEDEE